jgi:hypothetical protein
VFAKTTPCRLSISISVRNGNGITPLPTPERSDLDIQFPNFAIFDCKVGKDYSTWATLSRTRPTVRVEKLVSRAKKTPYSHLLQTMNHAQLPLTGARVKNVIPYSVWGERTECPSSSESQPS